VTSGNIANALTPGYAARGVTLGADAASGGVRVLSTDRTSDPVLTALRREADAETAGASILAEGTARLASAIGELGDDGGLQPAATRFDGALRALADTPSSAPLQDAAARAAGDLATSFNSAAAAANALRSETDAEIARVVGRVNAATDEIASLNRSILRASASGQATAGFVDRREQLIDEVNGALAVTVTPGEAGTVTLRTREGALLVGQAARPISFTATPVVSPGQEYAGGTGALSGLTIDGVDITPGGPGAQSVRTGALTGLFALRDEAVPRLIDGLDGAAADLVSRFEAVVDPTLGPTDAALFTDAGARLSPPIAPGIAGRLSVNVAIDPGTGDPARLRDGIGATAAGAAGDDTLLRDLVDALSDLTTAPGTPAADGPLDFRSRLAALSADASARRVDAEAAQSAADAARLDLADAEGAVIGVDQDRELERLVRLEQAYAANAQVIRTASAMLDELTRLQ
ncbi:MAG: flagellar hook-associated protein FlgK, partial [Pseudomonadota bacterium]